MNKKQEELIKKIRNWIKKNALCQTTYSSSCWDDGDIMFKQNDTEKRGDYSQEEWDEEMSEFSEDYIDYNEFKEFLDKLEKGK